MWNYESKLSAEWIGVGPNFSADRSQARWGIFPIGLSEGGERSRVKEIGLDVKEAWGWGYSASFVLWRSRVRPSRSREECEYTIFQSQSQVEPFLSFPTSPNGEQRRTWPFEVLRFWAARTFVYPGFLSCRNRSTTMESILATEIGRNLQHLASLRISRSSFMAFRPRPAFWSTLAGLA